MEEDPDIDIEENGFIYPVIESIYSDVNIKTEPFDNDEEVADYDSIEMAESSSDYYMPIPNKIILGSKPSSLTQMESVPGPSTASDIWENQENFFECDKCNLLFPTRNELDSHKTATHSFLVARPTSRTIKVERKLSIASTSSQSYSDDSTFQQHAIRRQIAVKSTSKNALNKSYPVLYKALKGNKNIFYGNISPVPMGQRKDLTDKEDRLLCKHCDVTFPDEIALIKHTYELLPMTRFKCDICQITFETKLGLRGHRANHFRKTGEFSSPDVKSLLFQCTYCTCFLLYKGRMTKHLLKNHKVTELTTKYIKFTGKCAICSKPMDNYKKYNNHVMKVHKKVFLSKTPFRFDGTPVKLKCLLCNQIFSSRYAAYKHKAQNHPGHTKKQTFHTVDEKPIKQLPTMLQAFKPKLQTAKNLHGKKTYIPKQSLFKCNKCQIHFVNCAAAFAHSKRCFLAKGDWKCNKCRRTFTKSEISLHMEQHQVSEKFKVHIVCDKILSKVLCRCPKCQLHFDETAFGDHVYVDCIPTNGVDCDICNIKIHCDSFAKHRRYHKKYNFLCGDFIVIEFIDVTYQNPLIEEEKERHYKQKLLYCPNCTCHFYRINSNLNHHLEGKCEMSIKKCCTICGLAFPKKPYLNHLKYDHETLNLTLNDIKFVMIPDLNVINPVMPPFFHCDKCEVRFNGPIDSDSHNCSKQVFIKCPICNQKYDSVTYDIHLTFHNYNRSIKVDDVSSKPMIFFSCMACNYGFHNYDSIVEHCQKHYTNSEKLETKWCELCKLNYADDHGLSHSSNAKFKILKFDYEKLLTDDWLEGFVCLPKDVIEDTLCQSLYGVLRNVRLELLVEGPPERTLFKCTQCEFNFDIDTVVEHTMESCSSSPHFSCNSCNAIFTTLVAKTSHMNTHVIFGDDISFREIIFNDGNDKELNEALRTGRQKESLKFRNCHLCKLLIKKSDYDAHVSEHNIKVDIKQFKFRRSNKIISYKLFKPRHTGRKLYTVYKCKSCNGCIMQKGSMLRHKCTPPDKYEKCNICSLYFLRFNIKKHLLQHPTIPKFIPKNISVLQFEIIKNNKNVIKKRRRYSSDDDASTGSGTIIRESKTYDTRKVTGRPYTDDLSVDSQGNILEDACIEMTETSNTYAKKYIKNASRVEKMNLNYDSISHESPVKTEWTPEIKKELIEKRLDIETFKRDRKNELYQCERCYLCFAQLKLLVNHLSECENTTLSETPLICDQCDIIFHPSLITFHEKLHELVKENVMKNSLFLINIVTNRFDSPNNTRWLYKCKICNIHYLSFRTLETHFDSNHKNLKDYFNCDVCGLQFTQRSRTKHMRIQHMENKLSKDDLFIVIFEKKKLDVGEISLKAYAKSGYSKDSGVEIEKIPEVEIKSDGTINQKDLQIKKSPVSPDHFNINLNTLNSETFIDKEDIDSNSDILNEEHDQINHNLYNCINCSRHYLTKLALLRHILIANHKAVASFCDICGLSFDSRTLKIHKKIQHEEMKLNCEDFVINNLENENDNANKEKEIDLTVRNAFHNDVLDSSVDSSISLIEQGNDSLTVKLNNVKKTMKSNISGPIDNHVYKCVKCSVFYTNRQTLLLHIVIRKHAKSKHLRCDICGLMFGKGSLIKHKNIQHEKLKLSREDLIITDVFGSQLLDDVNSNQNINKTTSSIDTDDCSLIDLEDKKELGVTDLENKLTSKVGKKKQLKIFRLFECQNCRICVKKSQRNLHICCSDIQKKQCIKCALCFKHIDITEHRRLHLKYSQLSRRNFVVRRFGHRKSKNYEIYKCVSCCTHFTSLTALEWHMNTRNHQTKREYCNKCGLFFGKLSLSRHVFIHHNKLNLAVEQFNIMCVSNMSQSSVNSEDKEMVTNNLNNSINTTVPESKSERETPNVASVKKLFKCIECDVYFLNRASYYQHIYKHRKLDTAEYIDCNICEFQFLNESLGLHMKSHKDKSFCLDNLLIEEYQPNCTDSPKIECYFAKDSLNTKLVSTTTLLDNDDESVLNHTDEQLSIIDSTSDEIPKTKTSGPDNVDPDSCLQNSDMNHEEVLNPSLEVPKLDVTVKSSE